jgi:hypothetical protein
MMARTEQIAQEIPPPGSLTPRSVQQGLALPQYMDDDVPSNCFCGACQTLMRLDGNIGQITNSQGIVDLLEGLYRTHQDLQGCLHSLKAVQEKLRKRILEAARRGARIKDLEQELEDANAKIANQSVVNHEHQTRGGDLEQVTSSSRKILLKIC